MMGAATRRRLLGVLLLPLLAGGCEGSGESVAEEEAAFPGSAASLDALGRTILTALVTGDTLSLERVRLTKDEHNGVVWPELPASRPEINFPVEFAWENIQLRNHRNLGRILPRFRSRTLQFRGVRCAGTEVFRSFQVHTDCHLVFHSPDYGVVRARVFEEALERNGGFKIFRYSDHHPKVVVPSG